jgi:hypothetical protein
MAGSELLKRNVYTAVRGFAVECTGSQARQATPLGTDDKDW